ncbi:hypothetical protein [Staphylococcus pasteuri]|uniref:hypothetical protein n=1 Tax=Staphylococcus pasteuri TaxID=45972 RepID=UPI0012DF5B30|nr:hypothetical protein [Staphylococcus pasteuri]
MIELVNLGVLGPQQREFQKRNSTSNASWCWGPNKENFKKEIQQAMQVGAIKERIT